MGHICTRQLFIVHLNCKFNWSPVFCLLTLIIGLKMCILDSSEIRLCMSHWEIWSITLMRKRTWYTIGAQSMLGVVIRQRKPV